jgi:hypothetical protein
MIYHREQGEGRRTLACGFVDEAREHASMTLGINVCAQMQS